MNEQTNENQTLNISVVKKSAIQIIYHLIVALIKTPRQAAYILSRRFVVFLNLLHSVTLKSFIYVYQPYNFTAKTQIKQCRVCTVVYVSSLDL